MARWPIVGLWGGEYTYDVFAACPQPFPAVPFTLDLELSWFGRLSGRVQDDPPAGAPEAGIIKGRVFGLAVKFLKIMPVYYVLDEGQPLPLREFVRREWNLTLEREIAAPPVWYRGSYHADSGKVTGTWEIRSEVYRFRSHGRAYEWPVPGVTGTWEMARIDS